MGWKDNPQHGSEFSTNPQNCKACHGDNLEGGSSGVSCVPCHHGGDPGGMEPSPGCFSPGCHVKSQSHTTHFDAQGKGPGILQDETGCSTCHEEIVIEIKDGACDTCHSPSGAFDGVNDATIGAKANWADGVYEADGATLKVGKGQWCAGCHDGGDTPAFSHPLIVEPVVMDNPDADYVCNWPIGTGFPDQSYGDNVQSHALPSTEDCTATWTPTLPYAGQYNVYANWTEYHNRAHSAPYTINYDGGSGSVTVSVDQRDNGGDWYPLGTFYFAADGSESVVLSADDATGDAGDIVIADAVMFENVEYMGAYAPNVVGDNATYGYYVNGHNLSCTVCHDASSKHIDHNQRTYEVDETTCDPGPCVVVHSYEDGYRLSDVLGQRPMVIPKESVENPNALDPAEFALCFQCHDSGPLLALTPGDPAGTNFHRDGDPYDRNFHQYHLSMQALIWDSDWDAIINGTLGVSLDSMPSCTTCHNVHGAPSATMTRHGELISPAGTTDKVPSLNFCYAKTIGGRDCDLEEPYPDSIGGSMYFYQGPEKGNFVCTDCHGGYAFYYRDPV